MEISRLLAEWHPRLVHFPIVLLLLALVLDAAGLIWRNERAHWAGKAVMLVGTALMLLAFICGICAEIWAGRAAVPHDVIQWHELAATVGSWGFIGLTAWRLFLDGSKRGAMAGYVIVGLSLYGMMGLAGHLGGSLVQEYGAGVTGARADTALSMHDLNTLAQRQTDKNLEYSDLMHHAAGGFVTVLMLAIFFRELWPHQAGKVRWVGPALLGIGGVLLFFTADLDLYALSDPRQFLDREAQMHKLISIILVSVGVRLLLKQRHAPATEPTAAQTQFQNRIIAVFALVGGGLLFTHVHTVAPYANVAAGVYTNHIMMGCVALLIGGVKFLDDALPGKAKWRALLFPGILAVECFLLLTYTEGIPWWAGIGHYNRWGPNHGCIAPFGKVRAEFCLDPSTGQVAVRVLDRWSDQLVPVAATNLNIVVTTRYQDTVVPVNAVDGNQAYFRGVAAFLKDARLVNVRIDLPLDGRWRTSYTDPWVTPAITGIPPNEVAKFVCPMHEGIRTLTPGDCRLCGMPLVPIRRTPPATLHDDKFAMQFAGAPTPPAAGAAVTLRFTPQQAATQATLRELLVVHEHKLHLIIVNEDLSFFDHIHPTQQPDGVFTIDYRFPRNDRYLLFAEITPPGERSQVFRFPVPVGSVPATPPQPLPAPVANACEVGPYHVELFLQPRGFAAEREGNLIFRLYRDGRPVTDLEPYIGAMGHCVIISEDTQRYLHSHPEQYTSAPPPGARSGPEVTFHTYFPKPGRYKVWGQFKRGDEIIVADFVLVVEPPVLPRWLATALLFD